MAGKGKRGNEDKDCNSETKQNKKMDLRSVK
jgi:hypothetical protein